ncbi:MAG: polysaccharide biosynthesis/export family protein [Pseudomonadota bacterium]
MVLRHSALVWLAVTSASFFVSACSSVQTDESVQTATNASAIQGNLLGQYRLGVGDRVRIIVFGEPELSREYAVNDQGKIVLPLVGEVSAADLSVAELKSQIETDLSDGFLNEANVSAEIIQFRPFYILGEVQQPGEYPYSAGVTVMKAVASAQGFTYRANKNVVYVKRHDSDREVKIKLGADTPIYPGDVIRIGQRFF